MKRFGAWVAIAALLSYAGSSVADINVTYEGGAHEVMASQETLDAKPIDAHSTVVQKALADATSFVADHKKALLLCAGAVTVFLSLKHCSWLRGLVGLDTEDEINDWRVYIQD